MVAALKDGAYYASTGPELRGVHWEEDAVVVETSAVAAVIVQGQGSATQAVHGASMTRTRIAFDRVAASPWLRVTVVDTAGLRAWSQPVFREVAVG